MKICTCCKKEKPLSQYYKNGNIPHSHCKSCLSDYYKKRQRKLKSDAIAYKGSKCEICGYSKNQAALDFHHKDPSSKEFSISSKCTVSIETLKPELDKCLLLCRNCHAELHWPE